MNKNNLIQKDYGKRIIAQGVMASNDTFETGINNNDLIIGPSGSGKTGGYQVPNLQNPTDSMIISDTKGAMSKMFKKSLLEKGYQVHILDFVKAENSTCGYNPLMFIRRTANGGYSLKDVKTIVNAMMPTTNSKDPYWDMSARRYVTMLICGVMEHVRPAEKDMVTVLKLHKHFCEKKFESLFKDWYARDSRSEFAGYYEQLKPLENTDRTLGCILDVASNALDNFGGDEMKRIFQNGKAYDLAELGKRKTVLFLNTSDIDRSTDAIVNILYTQCFQRLFEEAGKQDDLRLKVPVRIVMDDFASGTVMEDFDKIISVIRSRDISVSIIIQSLSQLESLYGQDKARTILNNCSHKLYLGGCDLDTIDYVSRLSNEPQHKVASLARDKAYLMVEGKAPRIVDRMKPYSNMDDVDR